MALQSPGIPGILPNVDPDALKVVRRLVQAGHEAYLVGGCVRDLYLGHRPKDFDVATSATPEGIRKLFRNSRIIGRRFKLAHVFFGPKVIETATFRTKPRDAGGDPNDQLITHDNEWGSVEDDARRRDFTINALFFDVENQEVVDFVDGLDDLDHATVRTIGEPHLRFREDPVRMIRAIKFAARLDFQIEEGTWSALLEVAPDIVKCSRARLLEEIYKLLRSGSARGCFALLLESQLLQQIMPSYTTLFGGEDHGAAALLAALKDDSDGNTPAHLFWRYLSALDDFVRKTRQDVANGVLQAVLFAPLLPAQSGQSARQTLDRTIEQLMSPVGTALGVARRDRELARQILMAHRRITASHNRRRGRRNSLAQRDYFHDALVFLGVSVGALRSDGSELARWQALLQTRVHNPGSEADPPEARTKRRRRRGGRKRREQDEQPRPTTSEGVDRGAAPTGDTDGDPGPAPDTDPNGRGSADPVTEPPTPAGDGPAPDLTPKDSAASGAE